jgi:hypothetical protein
MRELTGSSRRRFTECWTPARKKNLRGRELKSNSIQDDEGSMASTWFNIKVTVSFNIPCKDITNTARDTRMRALQINVHKTSTDHAAQRCAPLLRGAYLTRPFVGFTSCRHHLGIPAER